MYALSCRYKITDIIGKDEGLGVENLKGSGMIAGESSLAYEEIITMNLVRLKWPHSWTKSTCIHIEVMNCTRCWSFKSKDHTRCLALTLLTGPAGHLQSHRDWSLSGEARTENHSSGQLAHYTHWSWGTQQGNVMQIVRPLTWNFNKICCLLFIINLL